MSNKQEEAPVTNAPRESNNNTDNTSTARNNNNNRNQRNNRSNYNTHSGNERTWTGDKPEIGVVLGMRTEWLDKKVLFRQFLKN